MTGLRKRTTWAGLSLCATAAASAVVLAVTLITISGFASIIQNVDCVPVKLVADFPTFAATLLGSLGHDPAQHDQNRLMASSSSSSYLTNDQSDDDPDDSLTRTDSLSGFSSLPSKSTILADYESDSLDKNQSIGEGSNNSTNQSTNATLDKGGEATTEVVPIVVTGDLTSVSNNVSTTPLPTYGNSTTMTLLGLGKKSHIIRLPNGQSFQFCDELIDLSCMDENAVCKIGACVCKSGFFLHRQSGLCQSISDLLKNCENDYQCQAFDVDLVCDTKSHERSFCDCAEGLYFDQESYSCIPCHRNTFVLATNNKELLKKLNQSDSALANSSITESPETATPESLSIAPTLRPCKPIDLAKLNYRRRKQQVPYSAVHDQSARGSSSLSTTNTLSTSSTSYHHSSSDPFRIKTPLDVFIGAIMLFTLLTVAWFFLQRMFHDCRVILRTLRNSDFAGHSDGSIGVSSHLTNIAPNSQPGSQLYLDPAGQAVARLLSNDGYNSSLAGLYQRDLAGVMVQHLAANLSPSSTNHTLAATNGSLSRGDNEINLYPLTISSQQSRSAAAAAAAQLLLSPGHPAIAILRAAAASANQNSHSDFNQTSLLNSMLDPPPKYEEAIAQAGAVQPSTYVPQLHDSQTDAGASDDNEENRDDDHRDDANGNSEYQLPQDSGADATNTDQIMERNDEVMRNVNIAGSSDVGQPPAYQSADTQNDSWMNSSTTSSCGPSEAEQTSCKRQNSARKKVTKRSRRGRDSKRNSQQQLQQASDHDSDDTLTQSH